MKKIHENQIPFAILCLLGIAFVFLFYGKILLNPEDYIFSASGDGLKNYYTFAYHIKHDSTYTEMEGMNYPYGENHLYTDCHPVLSNSLKFLSASFPFFEKHATGLLNLFMILSIFISFLVIYALFVELNFNRWYSIIFSFCIGLLAPQLFRLGGHLALSYSFAIPLSWLLILKCSKSSRAYLYVLLFLNNIFWMFIHAYLGMIIISFLFSFLLFTLILDNNSKKRQLRRYIRLGSAIILPLVLFYAYVILTDTHSGRTDNPSGFFLYNAEIDDILIPHDKPFRPLLNQVSGGNIKLEWEARGYLGIINALFFVYTVILSMISIFYKRLRPLLSSFFDNKRLNVSLLAATLVLLFALAIPFKQIPGLVEVFPVLKQFRATGRFVWPFYFVFSVFAAHVFQEKILLYQSSCKEKVRALVFLLLYACLGIYEGYYYHAPGSESITRSKNLFMKDHLPEPFRQSIKSTDPGDYQAIISMPFFYQGSESFSRPRQDEAVRNTLLFSYHTGIPTVCANLTRTSVEESKRIVQIVSPNYYPKRITNDLPGKKPFLIVKTGDRFTNYEQAILEKADALSDHGNFALLRITYEDLFSDDAPAVIEAYQQKLPHLARQDAFYVTEPSSVLYYHSFEESPSDKSFRGKGSRTAIKKGKNTFAEFAPNTFEAGKEYDLSIWMHNGEQDALNLWFRLIVEEYDAEKDHWYSTTFFPEQAEVINGNWSLVEGTFSVHHPKNSIYIVSKGKENSRAGLHVDDILVKEKGVDVYRMEKDGVLFFNNHRVMFGR